MCVALQFTVKLLGHCCSVFVFGFELERVVPEMELIDIEQQRMLLQMLKRRWLFCRGGRRDYWTIWSWEWVNLLTAATISRRNRIGQQHKFIDAKTEASALNECWPLYARLDLIIQKKNFFPHAGPRMHPERSNIELVTLGENKEGRHWHNCFWVS